MPKTSTVAQLPQDILEQLHILLSDPRVTQLDATQRINAILAEKGETPISKSAVNRYALSFKDVMAKKMESNEVVKNWISQVGVIPDGDFGRAIVEILRTLSFDMSLAAHQQGIEDLPGSVKMLKDLSFAVEKLEKAASENEKRDAQIRQKARTEAAEELTKELKNDGISTELEASIRRILIGAG